MCRLVAGERQRIHAPSKSLPQTPHVRQSTIFPLPLPPCPISLLTCSSDTSAVFAAMTACTGDADAIVRIMEDVHGPWAMVYWHAGTQTLWFGRDPVGRRSLLWRLPADGEDDDGTLVIASAGVWWPGVGIGGTTPSPEDIASGTIHRDTAAVVGGGGGDAVTVAGEPPVTVSDLVASAVFPCQEIPPTGLYALRFASGCGAHASAPPAAFVSPAPTIATVPADVVWRSAGMCITRHAWRGMLSPRPLPVLQLCSDATSDGGATRAWTAATATLSEELHRRLSQSVRRRVTNLQRAAAPPPFPLGVSALSHTPDGRSSPFDTTDGVTRHVALLQSALGASSWDQAARALPPVPPWASHCRSPASVAVLFSGGLDSLVMAALAHVHTPPEEPIDLFNVCFAREHASPDRLTALAGVQQLRACYPARQWHLVRVDESFAAVEERQAATAALLAPRMTHMDYNIGSALWYAARGVGYVHTPDQDAADAGSAAALKTPTIEALAALAAMRADAAAVHRDRSADGEAVELSLVFASLAVVPWPVGLHARHGATAGAGAMSVSHVGPATAGGGGREAEGEAVAAEAAKRPTARAAKLPRIVCRGQVRLGERCRGAAAAQCPKSMCHACCATGAPSIGSAGKATGRPAVDAASASGASAFPVCAFHAAAGAPVRSTDGDAGGAGASRAPACLMRSAAKVVLVGIGADEHMGGYARHRTKWHHGGWPALVAELDKDIGRLWKRNLGRDDRMCSDHGREVRSPYLDEEVTAFLRAVPLPAIVNPILPPGVGDKLILRLVASSLGLSSGAGLVKRAIHFGSRIAKQSNVHTFGSNAAAKGDAVFRFAVGPSAYVAASGGGSDSDE